MKSKVFLITHTNSDGVCEDLRPHRAEGASEVRRALPGSDRAYHRRRGGGGMSVSIFINPESTLSVTISAGGVSVATRETPDDVWSPPIKLSGEVKIVTEEVVSALRGKADVDWFAVGAEAGASNESFTAFENIARALLGLMYEGGFPPHVFSQLLSSKLSELHQEAEAR